jgi:ABC-type bacteriocin/lantibiotic exporter with double-glycine peptidase domain
MPSVRNMMSGWSALKYNRYTIDILRDIDLNDEKPEPSAAQPPLPFEREIAVRDLSFRFDDERGDKEVLHGLTLTIRKGEHVGIRGASGAGKTTLFNLLLGFYTDVFSCYSRNISETCE